MVQLSQTELDVVIETVSERIKAVFSSDGSGHDIEHVMRVFRLSRKIAVAEKADLLLVSLAALLHDVGDYKLSGNGNENHRDSVNRLLAELELSRSTIESVIEIVENISFKGNETTDVQLSLEGQCVRDADRLDAMGAIGVARTFAYGAIHKRPMYNPLILPQQHNNFGEYKKNQGPTLNHFYEKLLLLKDRMGTETGKQEAKRRHDFLELYLKEFLSEWD
ncbi:MAG: phosphohydrolase [Bacteroidetes bacterium HGW-Bacteroidetes-6]|jgi:uncharacterized protein|nr:MAG: phosphohydrolase [Bacteroidetes bacterium HGW-Bacteroidetes-6]